jgi:hypothetical protein
VPEHPEVFGHAFQLHGDMAEAGDDMVNVVSHVMISNTINDSRLE